MRIIIKQTLFIYSKPHSYLSNIWKAMMRLSTLGSWFFWLPTRVRNSLKDTLKPSVSTEMEPAYFLAFSSPATKLYHYFRIIWMDGDDYIWRIKMVKKLFWLVGDLCRNWLLEIDFSNIYWRIFKVNIVRKTLKTL